MQHCRTLFRPRPPRWAGGARVPLALITALALAATLGGCDLPAPPWVAETEGRTPAAVDAALDSVYATFTEAYARANVQLLMDRVYAHDAYYLPPGTPILEGQDQFRGQFSFLERYARGDGPGPEISFDIVDRDVDGDLAYDIGVYTLRAPDAPPGEVSRGKFVVVWKRNARGEWRIHADSYSPVE